MKKYIKLIESKAIREYLDEIGYIPSVFEVAYIVYNCKKLTLKEKHRFWNEIIETTPDETLEKEFKIGKLTLHEFLSKYMEIQNKLCEQFLKKEENVVYTCSSGVVMDLHNKKPLIKNPFYWCNIYTDINMCIKDAQDKKYPLVDVRKHYIKTKSDDGDYRCILADLTSNGEILDVGELFVLNDEEEELEQFLKTETISMPLPFKKNDLIYSKGLDCELMEFKSYKNGHIYVSGIDKADCFCLNNDLDIEFADKSLCVKMFKEAIHLCDDAVINFIKKKGVLSEEEISNIYKEMR